MLNLLIETANSNVPDISWRDFEICDNLVFALRCLQVECENIDRGCEQSNNEPT